jgi:hypothetical protein
MDLRFWRFLDLGGAAFVGLDRLLTLLKFRDTKRPYIHSIQKIHATLTIPPKFYVNFTLRRLGHGSSG